MNGERTHVQARLGVGADVEPLIDEFRFPISIRSGLFAPSLQGKEDVILDGGAGLRYSRSAFMQVENRILDARTRQALLEFRNFAVVAISRKRRVAETKVPHLSV